MRTIILSAALAALAASTFTADASAQTRRRAHPATGTVLAEAG